MHLCTQRCITQPGFRPTLIMLIRVIAVPIMRRAKALMSLGPSFLLARVWICLFCRAPAQIIIYVSSIIISSMFDVNVN